MSVIINDEKTQRDKLTKQYNNYCKYLSEYLNKSVDVLKYMFFNPQKYKNTNSINTKNNDECERIFKKLFSKIFVVSNTFDIKKYYQIKDKFLYFNLSFDFFFKDSVPELYSKYICSDTNITFNEWTEIYTFLQMCEEIKLKNYKKTLILCDDIILNTKICDMLKYNKNMYSNWETVIFDINAFAINIKIIDVIIQNLNDMILHKSYVFKNIFHNTEQIEMENVFLSQIKKKNIIDYQEEKNNAYEKKIKNMQTKSEIALLKKEELNMKYIYETNSEKFYLSLPYENLLENNKKYYEYLNNKNIALIGPSPSIKKNKNSDEIDSYDVIVKINNSIFYDEDNDFSGNRIDVLYTLSIAQNLNQITFDEKYDSFQDYFFHLVKEKNIKFIVFSNELHANIHNQWLSLAIYKISELYNIHKIPIIFMSKPIIENHVNSSNKIPSAGYGAIMNLMQYNINKLYIKGFTFFKDGHTNSYIGKEWKLKMEKKSSDKIKNELNNEEEKEKQVLEEKIIHSLIKNDFCNLSPHNFDFEYKSTIKLAQNNNKIVFDKTIEYLYKQ